jgi:hypothetical protein
VTEHNYFHFGQQYYKQTDGWLAMDAPTSTIFAKTYIQHMGHKQI